MRSCFDSLVSHQNCTLYYLFVSMFLDVEARAARPPLLLSQGAASLHDRRTARVAVAISRARERLLVAARLECVQSRLAELDVDLLVVRAPPALGVALALTPLGRREEGAVCAEDHVAPVVPVPPRVLQPLELLAHALGRTAFLRAALALDEALPLELRAVRPDRGDRAVRPALRGGADERDEREEACTHHHGERPGDLSAAA